MSVFDIRLSLIRVGLSSVPRYILLAQNTRDEQRGKSLLLSLRVAKCLSPKGEAKLRG